MFNKTDSASNLYYDLGTILDILGESPYGEAKIYQEETIKISREDLMGPCCVEINLDGEWVLVFAYDWAGKVTMVCRMGKWVNYVQDTLLVEAHKIKAERAAEREELSNRKMPERFDRIDDAKVMFGKNVDLPFTVSISQ